MVESHCRPQDVMPWYTRSVRCIHVQTGLTQLLESQDSSGIDLIESGDELVKHLKVAMAREEEQRNQQGDGARHNQEHGVTQCLTRCLVAISRLSARREAQPTGGGEKGVRAGVAGSGVSAMLLSMNRGLLFPALSHETTCFLSRFNTDPREAVRVLCPLASALLLQPECESALHETYFRGTDGPSLPASVPRYSAKDCSTYLILRARSRSISTAELCVLCNPPCSPAALCHSFHA